MKPKRAVPDAYLEFGLASRRHQPAPFEGFHRHSEMELVYIESGDLTYLFSHGVEHWRAGQVVFFWGALPHQLIAVEAGTWLHWLTVPLAWFLTWRLAQPWVDGLLRGDLHVEPAPAAGPKDRRASDATLRAGGVGEPPPPLLAQFERWHADLAYSGEAGAERRRIVLLELEAFLRRRVLARVAAATSRGKFTASRAAAKLESAPVAASGAPTQVEAMARFIAAHYTEPLRVSAIAAAVKLTPEYATTLFKRTCGRSLIDYVTEHRVSHAQRLLATTDKKILAVAVESGFPTPSRFYAAFEARVGSTPTNYRKLLGDGLQGKFANQNRTDMAN